MSDYFSGTSPIDFIKDLHDIMQGGDNLSPERLVADVLDLANKYIEARSIQTDDNIEDYIRSLPWSEYATDDEKTLVAGNIRRFHEWLKRQ